MSERPPSSCPVCQTPFQGVLQCPQCQADLSWLMAILGRAYHLRCRAHQALCNGQYNDAYRFAHQAQILHRTSRGQNLFYSAAIAKAVQVDRGLDT